MECVEPKTADFEIVREKLKELMVANLSLGGVTTAQIGNDAPLFGDGLGLDSLDAVEIVVLMQRNFQIDVRKIEKGSGIFRSINALTNYICEHRPRA
jgi:acyl carrier protein